MKSSGKNGLNIRTNASPKWNFFMDIDLFILWTGTYHHEWVERIYFFDPYFTLKENTGYKTIIGRQKGCHINGDIFYTRMIVISLGKS